MKNLIKSLLAALMLVGFGFSSTVYAQVDCRGLSDSIEYDTFTSLQERCDLHNFRNSFGNFVDEKTDIMRLEGVAWDGIQRYGRNSVEPKKVVKNIMKSPGQFLSEKYGFYAVILEYGVEEGLQKILAYGNNVRGWERKNFNTFSSIDKYFNSISRNEIKVGAEKFSVRADIKKFLDKERVELASR